MLVDWLASRLCRDESRLGEEEAEDDGRPDEETTVGWWQSESTQPPVWQRCMQFVLCHTGPIPRHVAFVMDGNRRYARSHRLGTVLRGHQHGFNQLTRILTWCDQLGVKEVTVYAFAIDNFKRSEDEVGGLMELAERKFTELLDAKDEMDRRGVRFRIFGDVERLPPRLRQLVAQCMISSEMHSNGYVNVCMPYSSQEEVARAMTWIRRGREAGVLQEEDVTDDLLMASLDSGQHDPPDLLVRTSGELRLSDFLLLQCANSHMHFSSCMWPEFGFPQLVRAVVDYQRFFNRRHRVPTETQSASSVSGDERIRKFLSWKNCEWRKTLQRWAETPVDGRKDG